MLTEYFISPSRILELRSRPRGALLEAFAQALNRDGYSKNPASDFIRAAEHFLCWTDQQDIAPADFNEVVVERFAAHLDACICQGMSHVRRMAMMRGVRVFLAHQHSVDTTRAGCSAIVLEQGHALFSAFCQWMREQRGTSDATLYNYSLSLRSLLELVGDDPGKLNAQCLRQFVLKQSQCKGLAAAKKCTTALRMFIRFLIADGKCSGGLDASIPVLAHWRLSSLPRYLQEDEVERVIASCDSKVPAGKRDRAILLLLARLGLRAGDILHLHIADIDWKGACISVSGKSQRQTLLPLTQEVGQAIVDYLQQARPRTDSDTLFVRARAPFRAFASHCAISVIVERAMRRAGVTCPSRGAAHVLRHSAATSMLRHGASLQDIAAVLRHRSITTTQIYAKVDVTALRQIAQPWPEEESC